MFVLFSILAASIDGFVSGILIAGMGVKPGFRQFLYSFAIIFTCCLMAACGGNILQMTGFVKYINISGAVIMTFLAINAFVAENENSNSYNIHAVSLSVAADAAIVCIYLAAEGHSVMLISTLSAFLHSMLMAFGVVLSSRVISKSAQKYTGYISAAIFAAMAIYKLTEI